MTTRTRINASLAIGYLRVSTDAETQELGLEAQRVAIESWAIREGITVAEWHQDEASGGAPLDRRPGLLEALEAVRARRAGILVVQKRDRFTRDARQTAPVDLALERCGARVLSADGAGNGADASTELLRGLLDAFSRFERSQIAQRTKAALQVKKARGERVSLHLPYGQELAADGRTLQPNARETEILACARALRRSGLTYKAVSAALAAEGYLNRANKPFALQSLQRMV